MQTINKNCCFICASTDGMMTYFDEETSEGITLCNECSNIPEIKNFRYKLDINYSYSLKNMKEKYTMFLWGAKISMFDMVRNAHIDKKMIIETSNEAKKYILDNIEHLTLYVLDKKIGFNNAKVRGFFKNSDLKLITKRSDWYINNRLKNISMNFNNYNEIIRKLTCN